MKNDLLTVKQLNFEQVQKIYNGESVQVSGMKFLGATLRDFSLGYDSKTNQISMKALDETEMPEKKKTQNNNLKPEKRKRMCKFN